MFKGKPKAIHFQPISDKIRVKLATWKASLPSIAGRVQMVKSVIHNRLNYSFDLLSFPMLRFWSPNKKMKILPL